MLNPEDKIKHGLQSYDDYCELCLMEELPEWVKDINQALHDGSVTPLLDKNYEPWVVAVYHEKAKAKSIAKSDTVK